MNLFWALRNRELDHTAPTKKSATAGRAAEPVDCNTLTGLGLLGPAVCSSVEEREERQVHAVQAQARQNRRSVVVALKNRRGRKRTQAKGKGGG